jgi:hypothetical protein
VELAKAARIDVGRYRKTEEISGIAARRSFFFSSLGYSLSRLESFANIVQIDMLAVGITLRERPC